MTNKISINLLITLLLILTKGVLTSKAQDFNITSTNTDSFPKVRIQIQMLRGQKANKNDFKILDNGRLISFELQNQNIIHTEIPADTQQNHRQAVCFLIETSELRTGQESKEFKNSVVAMLEKLHPNTLANVCWFGKTDRSGRTLNILSTEFSTDKEILVRVLKTKIFSYPDSSYKSDVFKAIDECLDFMANKTENNLPKKLIVLSSTLHNSQSKITLDDCTEKSKSFDIPIFSITYQNSNRYASDNLLILADNTKGKSAIAKNEKEILNTLLEFYLKKKQLDQINPEENQNYNIVFLSNKPADDKLYSIEISHKGQKLATTYLATQPNNASKQGVSFIKKYWKITIGLFTALMVYLWWKKKEREKTETSNPTLANQSHQQPTENIAQLKDINPNEHQTPPLETQTLAEYQESTKKPILDNIAASTLNHTIIASNIHAAAPILVVLNGQNKQNYRLEKNIVHIGRSSNNELVLADNTVSAAHTRITGQKGHFLITDLNSTNGTRVNGTPIDQQILQSGDKISLGAVDMIFVLNI